MKPSLWTDSAADAVGSLGETGIIQRIRQTLAKVCPPAPRGIGDDCAEFTPAEGVGLFTSDNLALGRHFTEKTPARAVGRKSINRCISDLAGSGGRPGHALLNLYIPANLRREWLDEFIHGVREACESSGLEINGGDLTEAPPGVLLISVSTCGWSARPLHRGGARAGDQVWVTGELGGSLLGHHLEFTPRIEEGAWLAGSDKVVAAMDVTDGLAKDLAALLGDGMALRLGVQGLPIAQAADLSARASGHTPVWHACNDGEDYELAFVTRFASQEIDGWRTSWERKFFTRLTLLGEVIPAPDSGAVLLDYNGNPLVEGQGYQHFTRKED